MDAYLKFVILALIFGLIGSCGYQTCVHENIIACGQACKTAGKAMQSFEHSKCVCTP